MSLAEAIARVNESSMRATEHYRQQLIEQIVSTTGFTDMREKLKNDSIQVLSGILETVKERGLFPKK
jgi:hypothetical protein